MAITYIDQPSSGGNEYLDSPPPQQSIPDAVKQAIIQHLSRTRDELTLQGEGPVNMASALPRTLGAAGAVLPVPGGATMGTAGGHVLADAALASIGRQDQIPSVGSQVLDTGLAAIGDATAIPYLKKAAFGKEIGAAENAAKVVTRAPDKLPTSGTVGEYLNTLESQIDNGTVNTAQAARDAYAGTKYINSNPNLVGKSDEIKVQAARVGAKAQMLLNSLVKGRARPAAGMAKAMTIPNAIGRGYRAIPTPIKTLAGLAGAGTLADALARRIAR